MSKTAFCFVIIVLVSVAVIQSNYQKKIIKLDESEKKRHR